jgi:hypothetical protein
LVEGSAHDDPARIIEFGTGVFGFAERGTSVNRRTDGILAAA